jgi:hypothetical protein
MKIFFRLALAAVSVFALSAFAQAADYETQQENPPLVGPADDNDSLVFGNIHASNAYVNSNTNGGSTDFSQGNLGGKVSFEPISSQFGAQVDLDVNAEDLSTLSPAIPAEGTAGEVAGALHGTFAINDDVKIGVFAGFENQSEFLKNITDNTYVFGGATNLSEASSSINFAHFGSEALYVLTSDAWVQGRFGLVKPLSADLSVTDATTGTTSTASIDLTADNGYELGLGGRYGFTPNFSMRDDLSFISLLPESGGYSNVLSNIVTGQYSFDFMPISAYGQLGYQKGFSDSGPSTDLFKARLGLMWSFGGITDTTRGKLFRTSGFDGNFN